MKVNTQTLPNGNTRIEICGPVSTNKSACIAWREISREYADAEVAFVCAKVKQTEWPFEIANAEKMRQRIAREILGINYTTAQEAAQ